MSIHIQIEKFEGPLGLLLHLIRKEEMDIFDININQITKQYMDFIKAMKQLDLEVAGEFIAMAATLIQIKSRMLLPTYNDDGEIVEDDDPRKELVNKLLEYQKFKEAAEQLYERPLIGRDIWLRGKREIVDVEDDGEVIIEEENALFALISCYRGVIRNMKSSVHKVGVELQSIAERVLEIRKSLIVGARIRFSELMGATGSQRDQALVTFLSLLELAKMGFISLFQADSYSEIHIESKKVIESDAISLVEDYENNAEDVIQAQLTLDDVGDSIDGDDESQFQLEDQFVESATDEEIAAEVALMGEEELIIPEISDLDLGLDLALETGNELKVTSVQFAEPVIENVFLANTVPEFEGEPVFEETPELDQEPVQ